GHRLDRGARYRGGPGQTAIPLGLWHAAMFVEAPEGDAQAALRNTRSYRSATNLVVPVSPHCDCAACRLGTRLADRSGQPADLTASGSIRPRHLAEGHGLLRRVSARRPRQRDSCSYDGAARKIEIGAVARAAALRLPAAHVLGGAEGAVH